MSREKTPIKMLKLNWKLVCSIRSVRL